jgi:hypothetical protein
MVEMKVAEMVAAKELHLVAKKVVLWVELMVEQTVE